MLGPSAALIHSSATSIALAIKINYEKAVALNDFFVRTPDADLVKLGITIEDVAIYKSAFADLAFQKSQAFDSSPFVKRLVGLGF